MRLRLNRQTVQFQNPTQNTIQNPTENRLYGNSRRSFAHHISASFKALLTPALMLVPLVAPVAASAGGLVAPITTDTASVMPKGIRSFRVGGVTTQVTDKYDGSGNAVPLAYSFNKAVTYNDLVKALPKTDDTAVTAGAVSSFNDMNSPAGTSNGMITARVTTTVPMFAYGINERLTLGVGVPIVYSNMDVAVGWEANSSIQKTIDTFMATGAQAKALALKAKLQNVVQTKIQDYGYKPLVSETHTDVGDTVIGLKYLTYKDAKIAWTITPKIVAPTGRAPDVNKVVDIAPGDEQWDVGLATALDVVPIKDFTATLSSYYTYQLASQKQKRVPTSASESISPDVETLNEKLGDQMGATLGAKYKLDQLWLVSSAYGLQYKAPDSYTGGGRFASERYNYLSKDTEQVMQAGQVGVSFSTVPLFQAKKFEIPMEANLNYTTIVGGRNVNNIDLYALELVSYF